MILDASHLLSSAQSLAAAAGTAVSTNSFDLSVARDIGAGEPLIVHMAVGTAFAGGTNLRINVIVADDAALTSNVVILGCSPLIVTASLTALARFSLRVPRAAIGSLGQRYLGVSYTTTGTYSAGTVTTHIVHGIEDLKYYPRGDNP